MEARSSSRPPLFEFAFIPNIDERLEKLAELAEHEEWAYQNTQSEHERPILYNYIHYTYKRLKDEEDKIVVSDDEQRAIFNTGLVTPNQEPIFAVFQPNPHSNEQKWYFDSWYRRGHRALNVFSRLPEMAHYFDDPSSLVFDTRRELRINVEHIIEDHKERFPEPYKDMDNFPLQNALNGAVEIAKGRVKRNYKTAIPQYYQSRIQILLPLCSSSPNNADLALVVEISDNVYRVSTCLTLDMAYNNARLLARPDRDWLQP